MKTLLYALGSESNCEHHILVDIGLALGWLVLVLCLYYRQDYFWAVFAGAGFGFRLSKALYFRRGEL